LWDLGLVYSIKTTAKGTVAIVMTLTSIGCPLFSTIEGLIKEKVETIRGVKKVTIDVTFEPPWTVDMMSKKAKRELGMDL